MQQQNSKCPVPRSRSMNQFVAPRVYSPARDRAGRTPFPGRASEAFTPPTNFQKATKKKAFQDFSIKPFFLADSLKGK